MKQWLRKFLRKELQFPLTLSPAIRSSHALRHRSEDKEVASVSVILHPLLLQTLNLCVKNNPSNKASVHTS